MREDSQFSDRSGAAKLSSYTKAAGIVADAAGFDVAHTGIMLGGSALCSMAPIVLSSFTFHLDRAHYNNF